jgi:peptidyl-prolyl cis-trans isomerase SurA
MALRGVRTIGGWLLAAGLLLPLRVLGQTPVAPVPTPQAADAQGADTKDAAQDSTLQLRGTAPGRAKSLSPPTPITLPVLPGLASAKGSELDRVVAIVNGDLILDSDVDQELRLEELEPYGESNNGRSKGTLRTQAIERLINRDLILQQAKLQPGDDITDAAVTKELEALRKNIPACKEYQCATPAGWQKMLASYGFTDAELRKRWEQRMIVLAFIEQRFRMGIKITQPEINAYYTKTLLPQYAERHATPPPVDSISDRIQEVLLQQRVSHLLNDWLQSLRAQGSIVLLHPGEDAP